MGLWAYNRHPVKIIFTLITDLIILPVPKFAHVRTVQLSWYVQKLPADGIISLKVKNKKYKRPLGYTIKTIYFTWWRNPKIRVNVHTFYATLSILSKSSIPYSLRDNNKLIQQKMKTTTFGLKSFTYYGAHLWNSLPVDIKSAVTLGNFKTLVKNWQGPSCHCSVCQLVI